MVLWEKLVESLDRDKLEEVAVRFRKIWLRRNLVVFENKVTCPQRLLVSTAESLEVFKQANRRQGIEPQQVSRPGSVAAWVKPDAEFVKVNWDASLDMKVGKMGMGVIMRDENGDALLVVCDSRCYVQSAEVAECLALLKVMQVYSELNVQKVVFEGDAKVIIDAVKNTEENLSTIGHLIEDIRKAMVNRQHWSIQFVYREQNNVAHILAKNALRSVEEQVWVEEVPACIAHRLEQDRQCKD
ncbi:uncharacterized protein LOC122301753 [Carya illinoinensis]|uniref:uncharacterized protein LOC122301753 n=1 Tax=Carya illinoinensis TaxID=32201 RepID=UPI001C7191EE|nr:uncharacterized protein LOC122301753 [Carya illinoinensis]